MIRVFVLSVYIVRNTLRVCAWWVTPSPPGLARQHGGAGEDGAEGELRVAAQQQIKRQRRRERGIPSHKRKSGCQGVSHSQNSALNSRPKEG